MKRTLILAALVALATTAPGASPSGDEQPLAAPHPTHLPWRVWWARNLPALAPRGQLLARGRKTFWKRSRDRSLLLAQIDKAGDEGARALLGLGVLARPADFFTLHANMKRPGREGQAALLALGLYKGRAAVGNLEAVMRDTPAGRFLLGDMDRPAPLSHRAAAAMALGLSGLPQAYQALRIALETPDLPDGLGAAMLIALSFSDVPSDAVIFERCLRSRHGGPLTHEAAAAALGRHAVLVPGARRLLARVLRRGTGGGSRGAAVGLWFEAADEDDFLEGEALKEAALHSKDPLTRLLALISLAGRGDPRAEEAIEAALKENGEARPYAILATGLLAKADPDSRARSMARLGRLEATDEAPVQAARLFLTDDYLTRPGRGRSLANLAGGSPTFSGADFLESILDLAATLGH